MERGLKKLLRDYEKTIVVQTLARNNGDRAVAAQALGITKRALEKMLERHHLARRRFTRKLPIPPLPPEKP
jgi:DNA-binding NtrC family response regulator